MKIKFIPWDKLSQKEALCIMKARKLLKYKPEFKIENGIENILIGIEISIQINFTIKII